MKRSPLISPELLERIVDASEDGIVVAEQEGDENILIYVNKGFERLTGYSADEILYRDCRFLQNEDRDQDTEEADQHRNASLECAVEKAAVAVLHANDEGALRSL